MRMLYNHKWVFLWRRPPYGVSTHRSVAGVRRSLYLFSYVCAGGARACRYLVRQYVIHMLTERAANTCFQWLRSAAPWRYIGAFFIEIASGGKKFIAGLMYAVAPNGFSMVLYSSGCRDGYHRLRCCFSVDQKLLKIKCCQKYKF